MQTTKLVIAAVLLAALSGAVWWAKRHPQSATSTSTPASPTMVNIPDASIESIAIQKKDASPIALERKNGKWSLTAPGPFADLWMKLLRAKQCPRNSPVAWS